MYNACAIIPVFNHPNTIRVTLEAVRSHGLPVILIDDGCEPYCRQVLVTLANESDQIHLIRQEPNQGKGSAVRNGLRHARRLGYSHALQIDADGQHNSSDIPQFLEYSRTHPQVLLSGQPVYDESVPRLRFWARYLTHIWVWINTLSFTIKDSMCGFRIYPVASVCSLTDEVRMGNRMDFDTEILVRWHWQGGEIHQIPTKVDYPLDGISHFRRFTDNWLISKMHARLFAGMLARLPKLLLTKGRGQSWKPRT